MEHLQQIVSPLERTQELAEVMRSDRPGVLREYIAQQVEMAYLAGLNRMDIHAEQLHPLKVTDTGQALTKARNYVKSKGLRI